jgi:hypothetical protein
MFAVGYYNPRAQAGPCAWSDGKVRYLSWSLPSRTKASSILRYRLSMTSSILSPVKRILLPYNLFQSLRQLTCVIVKACEDVQLLVVEMSHIMC